MRWRRSCSTRRSCRAPYTPQPDRGRSPDVNRALVDLIHICAANDMRNDGKNDLILPVILAGLAKQVLQDRNLRQPRDAAQRPRLLVFQNSAQQVRLSIFQTDLVLDLALADDRLADAADTRLAGY